MTTEDDMDAQQTTGQGTKCSEMVTDFTGFHRTRCSRTAKVDRDGKGYCRQHDPEAQKARDAKRTAKYNRGRLLDSTRRDVMAAAIANPFDATMLVDAREAYFKARVCTNCGATSKMSGVPGCAACGT